MKKILLIVGILLLTNVLLAQVPLEVGVTKTQVLKNIEKRNNTYEHKETTNGIPIIQEKIYIDVINAYYFRNDTCYYQKSFYPMHALNDVYKSMSNYVYVTDSVWVDLPTGIYFEMVMLEDKNYFRIDCSKE
ncbi:MAG TPA: hypothetical protein PK784_01350 [Tenuifilaceae bacterium]|nr:hypothetical protein [Tenuifilaceae bacterium]